MLVMGVLGFFLERHGFPVGPVVLGIVVGPRFERNFMFSMIASAGDPLAFFARPGAAVLGVVTILVWLAPPAVGAWKRSRHRR